MCCFFERMFVALYVCPERSANSVKQCLFKVVPFETGTSLAPVKLLQPKSWIVQLLR